MKKINSINLEIIANSVNSIAEQMGVILSKTGYSTNIKERKDLSVAVFSAKGELLSLAQHIPLHFSSLSGAVEVLTEKYSVEDVYEGDIFIANDPYCGGGSHLPDIVLLKPVFYQGELIAYMVNTGHHADKTRKGSTIYDEGLRIPVIKLYEKGELKQDVFDLIMLNFQKDYPSAGQVILNDNFRSTKQIVESAGQVIRWNKARFAKEIHARGGDGPPVKTLEFPDQQQECLFLLRELQRAKQNGGKWSDTAVLYRTNTQPRLLLQKLMEYNVPFRVRDQMPNLFEHWIAKNLFCYIRLAMGSNLRRDLLPVLNRPKRYLNRECLDDEVISWEHMLMYYEDKGYVCDRIEKLRYDLKMLGRMGPFAAVSYIRHVIGYDDYLREYAQFRRMNEEDLLETANELQESARPFKTYDEWFDYIEKYKEEMEQMRRQQREIKDGVQLATMHSSKGLEYERVFILDAAEGITPYKKAVLDADLEEERRMFYVAMTRAKKELTVCYAKKQFSHELKPSRFIRELRGEETEAAAGKARKNPLENEMSRIRRK